VDRRRPHRRLLDSPNNLDPQEQRHLDESALTTQSLRPWSVSLEKGGATPNQARLDLALSLLESEMPQSR